MSAWEWRKARGGWPVLGDPPGVYFHACDVNCNLACEPYLGLGSSHEPVNEGSPLCPACMAIVRAEPHGREQKVYAP